MKHIRCLIHTPIQPRHAGLSEHISTLDATFAGSVELSRATQSFPAFYNSLMQPSTLVAAPHFFGATVIQTNLATKSCLYFYPSEKRSWILNNCILVVIAASCACPDDAKISTTVDQNTRSYPPHPRAPS